MKQSNCGRIVSQRKPQQSLIRHYDTKNTVNVDRISSLKKKYIKPEIRTPLNLLSSQQSVQIAPSVTDFTNTTKQKYFQQEVSRLQLQQAKKMRNQDINQFRKKAEQTNQNINTKLNNIQEQLNRFKNLKQKKVLIQTQKVRQTEKQNYIRLPQSIKVSKVEVLLDESHQIEQRINEKLLNKRIQQSACKLLGQFKKQRVISQQFTLFVNRLKDQISLDVDFTQILLSFTAKQREAVRDHIKKFYPQADSQFFTISPIEFDPLRTQPKVSKGVFNIESISSKLFEFYYKIEEHFKLKLFHMYQIRTIDTLFQEISEKQITLGHLISYINMRTGKQFRNRALVKLLKRLGINNHIIDSKAFMKGFVKR